MMWIGLAIIICIIIWAIWRDNNRGKNNRSYPVWTPLADAADDLGDIGDCLDVD